MMVWHMASSKFLKIRLFDTMLSATFVEDDDCASITPPSELQILKPADQARQIREIKENLGVVLCLEPGSFTS